MANVQFVMFYRYFLILIFFFGLSYRADSSDYVDSLETKLILVDNSQKLLILDDLIPYYFRNEPLQALKKADKMLTIAQLEENQKYKIRAQRYIGISNSYLKSYHEEALAECAKIEINAKTNGFIEELILVKLDFADIYRQIGENTKSLEYQKEAYHLADSAEIHDLISITLNNHAKTYIELEDFDRANQALKQSLRHAKLFEQEEIIAETNIIYGDMYQNVFNHESALQHYQEAHAIYLKLKKDIQIAISLFKIGKCYFSMEEKELAFQNQLHALTIRNRIKDRTGLAESYNEIGRLCIDNEEYQRAINNLNLGLNYAEMINNNLLMQQSYDYLILGYMGLQDYQNAHLYQKKLAAIDELIYTEASEKKVRELESRNEIEDRDQQIRNLVLLKEESDQKLAITNKFLFTLILLLVVVLVSVIIFIRSYRDKRKINRILQERNEQVVEQNEKLSELNSTKDKFFSIIGHDLKSPLNSLSAFSHLLINHTASLSEEEIRTIARDLDKSLKNLYELLENLLGWASSQTGKINFKPENFKIVEVIRENIRLLAKAARNKSIKIEVLADEEITVNADINSIKTVIRNLLSNAIKFTRDEGVITIFVDEWKDCVEIGVHDTGIGMSQEDQQKIFDISAKHSTMGTNQEKGTGLGLILCKEFIERNHGTLMVESELGVGSTFKFTLPKMKPSNTAKLEEVNQA